MTNRKRNVGFLMATVGFVLMVLSSNHYAAHIETNSDKNDIAIKGYDPVAYFKKGKAEQGLNEFTASYRDTIYLFSSSKNRDQFVLDPVKYAPQYGGYCAYGMSQGYKYDINPKAWTIVDGKLYLNYNDEVKSIWGKDIPGFLKESERNWPEVKSQLPKQ